MFVQGDEGRCKIILNLNCLTRIRFICKFLVAEESKKILGHLKIVNSLSELKSERHDNGQKHTSRTSGRRPAKIGLSKT